MIERAMSYVPSRGLILNNRLLEKNAGVYQFTCVDLSFTEGNTCHKLEITKRKKGAMSLQNLGLKNFHIHPSSQTFTSDTTENWMDFTHPWTAFLKKSSPTRFS